jgi:hypothetical protein
LFRDKANFPPINGRDAIKGLFNSVSGTRKSAKHFDYKYWVKSENDWMISCQFEQVGWLFACVVKEGLRSRAADPLRPEESGKERDAPRRCAFHHKRRGQAEPVPHLHGYASFDPIESSCFSNFLVYSQTRRPGP